MSEGVISEAAVDAAVRRVRQIHSFTRFSGDEVNAVLQLLAGMKVPSPLPSRLGYLVQRAFATASLTYVRAPYVYSSFTAEVKVCPFPAVLGWVISFPNSAMHEPFLRSLLCGHYFQTRPALIGCLNACQDAPATFFSANGLKRDDVFARMQRFAVQLARDELDRRRAPERR